jgi:hypothetical protein
VIDLNLFIALICSMFAIAGVFVFFINYELTIRCWFVNLAWSFREWHETTLLRIVRRLPRWLVYWCAVRLMAHATQGKWSNQCASDLTAIEALQRWNDK